MKSTLKVPIVKRLEEIKSVEKGFKNSKWWANNYFAETNKKAIHISEVNFSKLSDKDLVRCFEYIVRNQEDRLNKGILK